MTWNLRIAQLQPGETREELTERLRSEEQEEAAPDPAEIRRMGDLLAAAAPSMSRQDVPKGWMLKHAGSGAQIQMAGDEFSMTVPRVFSPSMGRSVWTDLWPMIRLLSEQDYCVYAPQLGRVLNPEEDFETVVAKYSGAELAKPAALPVPSRSWWQFWK